MGLSPGKIWLGFSGVGITLYNMYEICKHRFVEIEDNLVTHTHTNVSKTYFFFLSQIEKEENFYRNCMA